METAHKLKVFLVDDSDRIRGRMASLIGNIEGVSLVGEAETPADATLGILQCNPDVVLLDLQLSCGTGFDVLKAVHPVRPGIVFIVLTNHAGPQYRQRCMAWGASHFLDKSREFGQATKILAELCVHH
jgi:DNA-binding NarL/FixJ family response regulator